MSDTLVFKALHEMFATIGASGVEDVLAAMTYGLLEFRDENFYVTEKGKSEAEDMIKDMDAYPVWVSIAANEMDVPVPEPAED